jgi:hypothetical protein
MRRALLVLMGTLLLGACDQADEQPAPLIPPQPPTVVSNDAIAPLARERFVDLPAAVQTEFQQPSDVSEEVKAQLLDAIAGSRNFSDIIRRNARRGGIEAARTERDLARARRDLVATRDNLQTLSSTGIPTFVLIHTIEAGAPLKAWLISPDGGIVYDQSAEVYTNLNSLSEGLGVRRIAVSMQPRPRGEELPTAADIAEAEAADNTVAAVAQRKGTLPETAEILLPGKIRHALGTRHGRLLIIPAFDTGTAPYAALPLANGYLAENWSVVVVPGIAGLAQRDFTFDFKALDLSKAVIFGDPDLSDDTQVAWKRLKGAQAEAFAAAETLGIPADRVMTGENATRAAFLDAMNERSDIGLVYIASHAVSDPQNPLTKGYIAMRGGHYFAGSIRSGDDFPRFKEQNPLVVLSACQSGLGGTLQGGHFGVAQSWMAAGAGQVVASLWNVGDNSTKALMGSFVSYLKTGDAPEFALQKAQIDMLNYRNRSGNYPFWNDPKKWAGFTVFGQPALAEDP